MSKLPFVPYIVRSKSSKVASGNQNALEDIKPFLECVSQNLISFSPFTDKMKFINSNRYRLSTIHCVDLKSAPDCVNTTMPLCDDEILIHQQEFNSFNSQRKELETLMEENEKLNDLKEDCEKQNELFPKLQWECRHVRNKLNKILRNIWMNTRYWRARLDTPQVLMKIVESAVICREEISITNEMIADFMDALDFYNIKLFQGDTKRKQIATEFECEIKLLEEKLMMTIKDITDITSQKQVVHNKMISIEIGKKDLDISHMFVTKTRYSVMCKYSRQLNEVRTINKTLKAKDWEKAYINARDKNLILRKNLARWSAEIDLAKKIAAIVVKYSSFQKAKCAINFHLPTQEQPSVRSLEAIVNDSNNILEVYMAKRDEAEILKEALKSEQLAYELRVSHLDTKLQAMRDRLAGLNTDLIHERER